jgi:uncharacterized protein (TIGR03000 family)
MSSVGRRGRDDGEGRLRSPAPAASGAMAFQLVETLARPRVEELEIARNKKRCIMFRQMFTRVGVPAVVAAALLMAGPAWAKGPGGGGHGGGFHGGISHGGGFHNGGFHGGSTHFGRVHHGDFHHGYYPFIGYYTPYGYYSSGGYYTPYEYYPSNDPGYGSAPDQEYSNSYEGVTPSTVSPDTAPAQADSTAHVTVRLPANAELWFNDSIMKSTGPVREFRSPQLKPGQFTYEIRGRWTENGHDITRTQKVPVSPGDHITVEFLIGAGSN